MIRTRFRVIRVERSAFSQALRDPLGKSSTIPVEIQTVLLTPVATPDPDSDNLRFWGSTPQGEVRLSSINAASGSFFELGHDYYIDFQKAEPDDDATSDLHIQ